MIAATSCSSTPSTIPDSTFSGKQFSQQFEFSFDYVRFRKGINNSTVLPENNPYTGPYADTVPPISEKVNCDPNYFRGCKAGTHYQHDRDDLLGHVQAGDNPGDLRQDDVLWAGLADGQEHDVGAFGDADRLAAQDDVSLPHEVSGQRG